MKTRLDPSQIGNPFEKLEPYLNAITFPRSATPTSSVQINEPPANIFIICVGSAFLIPAVDYAVSRVSDTRSQITFTTPVVDKYIVVHFLHHNI